MKRVFSKSGDRFHIIREQDSLDILTDTQTGVSYLFYGDGDRGGLTPLINSEGQPLVEQIGSTDQ